MPAKVLRVGDSGGGRVVNIECNGFRFQAVVRRVREEDGYRLWLQRFNTHYETEDAGIRAALEDVEQLAPRLPRAENPDVA